MFRKDKDKQAQIDKLTDIAEATNRQAEAMQAQLYQYRDAIRLQHRPSIKVVSYDPGQKHSSIRVTVSNYGKHARIILLKEINDCFIFLAERNQTPYDFNYGASTDLRFILRDGYKFENAYILFDIIYKDEIDFFYKATLTGNGEGVDLPPGRLLTPHEMKAYNL